VIGCKNTEETMFLKGFLLGIGFMAGMGLVASVILGLMAMVHVLHNLAAGSMTQEEKPEQSEQKHKSRRAKLFFMVDFPSKTQEKQAGHFGHETEYLQ
jgi:Na+-transporting methylmalonyl-CoA/oxaloacetate decarboxylase gamma subunit